MNTKTLERLEQLEKAVDEIKKSQQILTELVQEFKQSQSNVVEGSAKDIAKAVRRYEKFKIS